MTRYLLAGGGTAGHVNPLLAVADRLRETEPDAVILVLGTEEGLERRLVPERGYELLTVARLPFPRRPNVAALSFPSRFLALVARIRSLLDEHRIDVVVGFGGYVSAPAYLAARRAGVAVVVHEANARPGMANRLGALTTSFVGVAFAGTRLRGARVVGMPLRREIERLDRPALRAEAYEEFGLSDARPTLVVTGGSLGARSINETIAAGVALVLGAGWQVLHITGDRSQIEYPFLPGYRVLSYCNRMDLALAIADLVLARAGSSTVSELTALGIPAVYVPLSIGNGEQRLNARGAVDAGAAVIVANEQFTPDWIADDLLPLLEGRAAIAAMAARALAIGVRDGADRTVELIREAVEAADSTAAPTGVGGLSVAIKSDFSTTMPDRPGWVHFVGIGGAGMSGIAQLFHAAGHEISGSDIRDTDTVLSLRALGIDVAIGHTAGNIDGADTLVVTGAIAEDNPEFLAARERGIPTVHRARALAWLTSGRRLVAVAGAHGKTTSTAMIIEALLSLGRTPSFVNGGVIRSLGTSAAPGEGDLFVVEADESDGSFLLYDTAVALITNVDPDHLDHWGSEEAVEAAFASFASAAREFVAISSDDPRAVAITPRISGTRVVTFGEAEGADVRVHSVETAAVVAFSLRYLGQDHRVELRVPGLHNALNAAGAFAVLTGLGIEPRAALDAVATFGGTERRFEPRGEVGGIRVFDDFAHHPTEIRAALTAARGVVGTGRVIPVFQPHLYSRTRMLAAEFAEVFESLADHTVVVPVYGARQDPEPGVTGALITDRFAEPSSGVYIEDWDEAARYAASVARSGDIVLPMGGGDIYLIVPALLRELGAATGERP